MTLRFLPWAPSLGALRFDRVLSNLRRRHASLLVLMLQTHAFVCNVLIAAQVHQYLLAVYSALPVVRAATSESGKAMKIRRLLEKEKKLPLRDDVFGFFLDAFLIWVLSVCFHMLDTDWMWFAESDEMGVIYFSI